MVPHLAIVFKEIQMKVGLIINPIAGMGGRVGLKGTDGKEILAEAIHKGAKEEAPGLAMQALRELLPLGGSLEILCASGDMGQNQCMALGLAHRVVYEAAETQTDGDDTITAAREMENANVDLLLFAGGDGTARDIFTAIETRLPSLGIPAGVKIHSPVYANTPKKAGQLAVAYFLDSRPTLRLEEVVDLDEAALRNGQVVTSLFGYLRVPYKKEYLQNKKAPTPLSDGEAQMAIALDVIDHMEEGTRYIIGPGTTTKAVLTALGQPATLLGIDVVQNRQLIARDCSESGLLELIETGKTKLILTPTGGQGYLLGRGNQQVSPEVLRHIGKKDIIILATDAKLLQQSGRPFLLFTGDGGLDRELSGYYKVTTGYRSQVMVKVSAD
jgi:predicted polyphosphate/ATP-dependent NAD kinase